MFRFSLLTPAEIRSKLLTVSQAGARRSPAGPGPAYCTSTAEYDARIDTRIDRDEDVALLGLGIQSASGVPAGSPPRLALRPAAHASHGWRLVLHPRGHARGVVPQIKIHDASSPSGSPSTCWARGAAAPAHAPPVTSTIAVRYEPLTIFAELIRTLLNALVAIPDVL